MAKTMHSISHTHTQRKGKKKQNEERVTNSSLFANTNVECFNLKLVINREIYEYKNVLRIYVKLLSANAIDACFTGCNYGEFINYYYITIQRVLATQTMSAFHAQIRQLFQLTYTLHNADTHTDTHTYITADHRCRCQQSSVCV